MRKHYTRKDAEAEASRRFKKENGGYHVVGQVKPKPPLFFIRSFKRISEARAYHDELGGRWAVTISPGFLDADGADVED